MRIGSHEYANEADDNVPKPAQSLGAPVPETKNYTSKLSIFAATCNENNYRPFHTSQINAHRIALIAFTLASL